MLKKPYFMKNKDWFYKTKLADTDTFNLTEIGKSIPEVFKSYKEYYNIKDEDLYEYGSDLESEFKIWSTKTIRKKMQEHSSRHRQKFSYLSLQQQRTGAALFMLPYPPDSGDFLYICLRKPGRRHNPAIFPALQDLAAQIC